MSLEADIARVRESLSMVSLPALRKTLLAIERGVVSGKTGTELIVEWDAARVSQMTDICASLGRLKMLGSALIDKQRSDAADARAEELHKASLSRFRDTYTSYQDDWGKAPKPRGKAAAAADA